MILSQTEINARSERIEAEAGALAQKCCDSVLGKLEGLNAGRRAAVLCDLILLIADEAGIAVQRAEIERAKEQCIADAVDTYEDGEGDHHWGDDLEEVA